MASKQCDSQQKIEGIQYIRWVEEEKVLLKELNREKTSFCISSIPKISYREIFE